MVVARQKAPSISSLHFSAEEMAGAADHSWFVNWTADRLSSWFSSSSADAPPSAEQEFQRLERIMRMIHATLDDAEEKDISDKSEQLRLRELKEVAYDVEDVMDEYEYQVLHAKVMEARRQAGNNAKAKDEVFDPNSHLPKASISNELAHRIKQIRMRFEDITNDWERIRLRERDGERRRSLIKLKPVETTSFFDEATTFGREDEKRMITDWLLQEDEPNKGRVSILAIVGKGGLGKTTLAQMVYSDPRVCNRFDVRGWVCISEEFDVPSLTKKILSSLSTGQGDNSMTLDQLFKLLKEILEGKQFLLVLDDVWNQKLELWEPLKILLTSVGAGKIIVTTRNEPVARIMQTTEPIKLKDLPFEKCWSLFEKIAFDGRDENSYNCLFDTAVKIVKKCQGLPLAVKVLASVLKFEEDKTWDDIYNSGLWELDQEKYNILPVLKFSYDRMPIELRPCFMYLSLFPKDSELHKPTVVKQWMSHGLLQPKGRKLQEDIGNDYFTELLQRSLLQHTDRSEIFIMHDLIHDLTQHVAEGEYLLMASDELHSNIPKTIRHVSLYLKENFNAVNLKPLFKPEFTKHLRTFILHTVDGSLFADMLENMTCLRTLILCTNENKDLGWICKLKHLRYLDISSVPESFYNLYHLQTLNVSRHWRPYNIKSLSEISDSTSHVKLSGAIGDLINLRHIHGFDMDKLPPEIGRLTNLQKLVNFKVGAQCKVQHLKELASLRGEITVSGLETIRWSDFTPPEDYMVNKRGIQEVRLRWSENARHQDARLAEQVLSCSRPHPNLRLLHISGYPGAAFSTWLGDTSLLNLGELDLYNCGSCTSLPTLGRLPFLKRLQIGGMKRVKSVGREFLSPLHDDPVREVTTTRSSSGGGGCFPCLQELNFYKMDEWEEWQGVEDTDFPRLRLLRFYSSPKLRRLPAVHSPCHLQIYNCPKLRRFPFLPSVSKLDLIGEWNAEVLYDLSLPVLHTLNVFAYPGASLVLPCDQSLRSLKELAIGECVGLMSVEGLGVLTSLQHLVIKLCPELTISANERLPPNVQVVDIDENSPGAVKWYENQVSGGSTDHQMSSESEHSWAARIRRVTSRMIQKLKHPTRKRSKQN